MLLKKMSIRDPRSYVQSNVTTVARPSPFRTLNVAQNGISEHVDYEFAAQQSANYRCSRQSTVLHQPELQAVGPAT